MKTTIYANYGVLAAEKRVIYTGICPHGNAQTSEKVTVEIPDSLNPYETEMSGIAISPENAPIYLLSEILNQQNSAPVIKYVDYDNTMHTIPLKRTLGIT